MTARVGSLRMVAFVSAGFLGSGSVAGSSAADPDDRDQVERGAALYAANCASCHGARLEGQPDWRTEKPDGTYPAPPHDADGHTWHHSDRLLLRYTRLGGAEALKDVPGFRSGMPGFGDRLGDREIRAIFAFLKAQWTERERDYQRAVTDNDKDSQN
ncbi:MAG: cytochrome c [Thermohalobaculum sp.]|nr:cytochrome c [Thermohalobaculum sp.]